VYDHPPGEGTLPPELAAPLAAVLGRQTATPADCFFAVWNGWGALPEQIHRLPTFTLPSREYHLLHGPVDAAAESVLDSRWQQSSSIWWPVDHAWCVATEVDGKSTYIGCSATCADELLRIAGIEAFRIDPATGIDWRSDSINLFE
jgi:hypothetical protein